MDIVCISDGCGEGRDGGGGDSRTDGRGDRGDDDGNGGGSREAAMTV
jgi:hypothetical protein